MAAILDSMEANCAKCMHCEAISSRIPKDAGRVVCPYCYDALRSQLQEAVGLLENQCCDCVQCSQRNAFLARHRAGSNKEKTSEEKT